MKMTRKKTWKYQKTTDKKLKRFQRSYSERISSSFIRVFFIFFESSPNKNKSKSLAKYFVASATWAIHHCKKTRFNRQKLCKYIYWMDVDSFFYLLRWCCCCCCCCCERLKCCKRIANKHKKKTQIAVIEMHYGNWMLAKWREKNYMENCIEK